MRAHFVLPVLIIGVFMPFNQTIVQPSLSGPSWWGLHVHLSRPRAPEAPPIDHLSP